MEDKELHLLGQILLDNSIFHECGLKQKHFMSPKGRNLYAAVERCISQGIQADPLTVLDKGASATVLAGVTSIPSSANWEYFRDQVKENWLGIQLAQILEKAKHGVSVSARISEIEEQLSELGAETGNAIYKMGAVLKGYIDTLEDRYKLGGVNPGIDCGIMGIDEKFLGFQKQRLYYIGARPSDGKSALMLTMALNMGGEGKRVGIVTLESSYQEVLDRAFAQVGNINSSRLRTGFFQAADFSSLMDTAGVLSKHQTVIFDAPGADLGTVASAMRRMVLTHKCEIIFIDYLQYIQCDYSELKEHQRLEKISRTLKDLSRRLNIPVVALAQLSRDSEGRRPQLRDFYGSSSLEKDADGAIMIWHEKKEDQEYSWLLIEKNRDGATGDIPVYFKREKLQFLPRTFDRSVVV